MNAKNIQKYLRINKANYSMVAEALGVSPSHVRNVAERLVTSHRVAQAIAVATGHTFEDVFPEYMDKTNSARKNERKKTVASLKRKIAEAS